MLSWTHHVNWLNVLFIIVMPLYGFIQAYWVPLQTKTAFWAIFYYFYTGIGITAGYHRLWAHRSYSATFPLRLWLALAGAGAVQGSIRWWARGHRLHHRYTDTEQDPYSVRKGLVYSHFGWMIIKQDAKARPRHPPRRRIDISDLTADPIVTWQHRHYLPIVVIMSLFLPTVVAGLGWQDWWGGFVYAGLLRTFAIQQATFCVNSLAHWLGDQPFDDKHSPRDHLLTALVTFGEGYHNFHHEFPGDYRNAVEWYQYDPTKWTIWICGWLRLACRLKRFRANEIEKGRVQQMQKRLDARRERVDWGVPLESLPVIEWDEFVRCANSTSSPGKSLVLIEGVVHDVSGFVDDHPGGRAMITSVVGKDATALFNGGVYGHSNAARNLLSSMRVGVLRGGGEVEIWKSESVALN